MRGDARQGFIVDAALAQLVKEVMVHIMMVEVILSSRRGSSRVRLHLVQDFFVLRSRDPSRERTRRRCPGRGILVLRSRARFRDDRPASGRELVATPAGARVVVISPADAAWHRSKSPAATGLSDAELG